MINEYSIVFPYQIGTVLEMKTKPNILAELEQYRITSKGIFVKLNTDIYNDNPNAEIEITIDELKLNWKKTEKIILKGDIGTRLNLRLFK